nr:MAG: RNA-dependent RNA polymerase [Botourmiaviridae sp.]
MQSTPLCASRLAPSKTACGVGVRCTCRRLAARTEETIRSAFKTIRLRFSLGKGELPCLRPADLGKYLLFLLSPRSSRVSTPFPRSQNGWDLDGFPRLSRLGRRQRWELAHSVSSVKKGLPSSSCLLHPPPSSRSSWFAKSCNPSPPLSSPEYLAFARKITRDTFPLGWDRDYFRFCSGFFPKRSSRYDRGFSSDFWSSESSFLKFQSRVQRGGPLPKGVGGWNLRYKDVPAAGKVRAMGIPTYRWDTLGPLHECIYSYLGEKEWMLVGPPTSSTIERVCAFDWQTSIDLVGATDNLRLDVADTILSALLARCGKVPGSVQLDAVDSLHPRVSSQEVTHGQMMGTYLSFPLLCLQSYVAARWATRTVESRILINGDDCLISSPSPVLNSDYPDWAIINETKTGRFRSVAEINSTCFLREASGRWREVKHLRRGGGPLDLQGHVHQAAVCRAAGTVWERAFALSKSRSRWCLLPSQLGFDTTVLETFKYERRLRRRGYVVLPRSTGLDDDRYVLRNEPSSVERLEVSLDLWVNGRSFETRHDQLSWSAFSRLIRKPGAARLDARRRGWRGGELSFSTRQVARVPRPRGEVVLAESRLPPEPGPRYEEKDGELFLVLEPSSGFP